MTERRGSAPHPLLALRAAVASIDSLPVDNPARGAPR
jgi:hypothetical protein